jgi:hypothetical protein
MEERQIQEEQQPRPEPDLRKLAHQLRNHLFTISLAVKSLELAREEPERFAHVLERIRSGPLSGIEEIARSLESPGADKG